jgi:hypothetical protein
VGITVNATSPVLIAASGPLLVDRLADAVSPVLIGAAGELLAGRLADATSVVVIRSGGLATGTAWVPSTGAGTVLRGPT